MRLSTQARAFVGVVLLIVSCRSATVDADEKPLWELGLGVGSVTFMDYRGADTSHVYVLPIPYFVYRGKFLEADRNGVRGKLFNQDWAELNVSVNATTPVRANATRHGMPDLRPTIELGPSLDLHAWRSADQKIRFDVRIPARAAFTVEAHPRAIGWIISPNATVDVIDPFGQAGWRLGLLAGPLFSDRRYDDYFYTVAPRYFAPGRPAYEATGGYAGTQILAALSKRYPAYWLGAYVRHDFLSGATFEPSPLVKRNDYWSGGIGIAWMITQSSRMVEADE